MLLPVDSLHSGSIYLFSICSVGIPCYVAVAGYLTCASMALLCIPSQTKPQSKRNEAQQGECLPHLSFKKGEGNPKYFSLKV